MHSYNNSICVKCDTCLTPRRLTPSLLAPYHQSTINMSTALCALRTVLVHNECVCFFLCVYAVVLSLRKHGNAHRSRAQPAWRNDVCTYTWRLNDRYATCVHVLSNGYAFRRCCSMCVYGNDDGEISVFVSIVPIGCMFGKVQTKRFANCDWECKFETIYQHLKMLLIVVACLTKKYSNMQRCKTQAYY